MKEDDKVFYTFYYNNPTETGGDFPTAKQTEVTLEFDSAVRWRKRFFNYTGWDNEG